MRGPFYSSYRTVHLYPAVVLYSNPLKIVKPAAIYRFELIALGVASLFYDLQLNQENCEHQIYFWNVIVARTLISLWLVRMF